MTVLFSTPVHERNDIIRDTLNNARRYNPGCVFVLHVSASFRDFDASIGLYPDVLINPVRFPTVHSQTSHVPLHLTNFKTAVDAGVDFDHVCILHTSEMFVKHGMEDYIKDYDYSLWFDEDTQPRVSIWPPFWVSFQNRIFKDLFDGADQRNYLGNVVEGHWWKRDLFQRMHDWTAAHYDIMTMLWPYAAEECYLATLGHHLAATRNFSHPYCCFHHKTHYVEDARDVDDLIANRDVVFWQPNNWVYNKIPFPGKNLYSIKRINREMRDPIRCYINSLT